MKIFNFKTIVSIIYIFFSALILCLFASVVFRVQKDTSVEENRTLQKVPSFKVSEFISGEYQTKMENSIGDQLLWSAEIKYGVKQFYNQLTKTVSSFEKEQAVDEEAVENVTAEKEDENVQKDKGKYVYKEVVKDKIYRLDDSGYLVEKAHAPEEYCFELYKPEMLAKVTYPKYLFFIMSSESADFNDLHKYKTLDYIKTKMPMTGYSELIYNSFDEYKKYFYQTDHHWNYNGSYHGYVKIMKMLEGDDVEVLKPSGAHTYDAVFEGSYARDNLLRSATQKFHVYLFNLKPYKTYVNDVEKEYGFRSWYVSDEDFPHKTYSNHYGLYYGDDRAKVVYDFNQPDKESILILGTSFTNAINELIASHYNKTHVLDFRHYKEWYGYDFDVQDYMTKNKLSKVVIIGNISSLGYRIYKD